MNRWLILLSITTLSGCTKTDNPPQTNSCSCSQQSQYLCWKVDGNDQSAQWIGKQVQDSLIHDGYINFSDDGATGFFFEYEDLPTPLEISRTYTINPNISHDFDIGLGDTLKFLRGSITIHENNTSLISGEFTADSAFLYEGDTINYSKARSVKITNGCFKLLK